MFKFEETLNQQSQLTSLTEIVEALQIPQTQLQVLEELTHHLPKEPKDYYPSTRSIKRHFIIHCGDTNSGKTYQSFQQYKYVPSAIYLAPLRLLALEVQERALSEGLPCSLITGEEEIIIPHATHFSSTIEKLNPTTYYDLAIIDEAQMLEDPRRGYAWTNAILGVYAKEVHICTAPHALDVIIKLINHCEDTYEVVNHIRDTELIVQLQQGDFMDDIQEGDAIIVFGKQKVLNIAAKITKEKNMACSLLYGALPYPTRKQQFQDFIEGKTKVIISTDAIGMGVNLPIKRVILLENTKFDGRTRRPLRSSELRQIGGRAGRKGIYEFGTFIVPTKRELHEFYRDIYPLKSVYLGISHHLLTTNFPLNHTFEAWKSVDFGYFFKKPNLSRSEQILELTMSFPLTDFQRYTAMFIPMDPTKDHQKDLLINYLTDLSQGCEAVIPPNPIILQENNPLINLESYYTLIDLYYSFSKAYHLFIDINLVKEERYRISNDINQLLLAEELRIAKCRCCGGEREWHLDTTLCKNCIRRIALDKKIRKQEQQKAHQELLMRLAIRKRIQRQEQQIERFNREFDKYNMQNVQQKQFEIQSRKEERLTAIRIKKDEIFASSMSKCEKELELAKLSRKERDIHDEYNKLIKKYTPKKKKTKSYKKNRSKGFNMDYMLKKIKYSK